MSFDFSKNIKGSSNINNDQFSSIADATSVVLDIHKKKVKVERSKILDIAKGLAEIAYSMGQTNAPDDLAEEMTDDILEALKKVKKRKKDGKTSSS